MLLPTAVPQPIRILLMGGHTLTRAALRALLESRPELTVVDEVASCDDVSTAARERPDIILLDFDLSHRDRDCQFLPGLRSAAKGARVLILTDMCDTKMHQQAVRLGAMGLVLKDRPAEDLIKAIQKVHAGEVWVDRSIMASVLLEMMGGREPKKVNPEAAKIARLTEREREVVTLVGEGLKNKQLAKRLHLSETTVRHHLTSIFNKLDLSDRCQLVIYAYRHGLIKLSLASDAYAETQNSA